MKIISLILVISLLSCSDPDSNQGISGFTMGTSYSVSWVATDGLTEIDSKQIKNAIDIRLDEINQLMSTYDNRSQISIVNQSYKTGWQSVAKELASLVQTSLEICAQSQGTFDITIGPLVNLWGFGSSDTKFTPPTPTELEIVNQNIGCEYLDSRLEPPSINKKHENITIDLSAIAKGYAVDQIATILDQYGLHNYLIEIGGELKAKGRASHGEFWRIGIETPHLERSNIQDIISLDNIAVATSGNYRNFIEYEGKIYSHVIDPRTSKPIQHNLTSVTVIDKNAARADAWATALLVLGPNEALKIANQHGLAIYMITREGNEFKSTYNKPMQQYIVR